MKKRKNTVIELRDQTNIQLFGFRRNWLKFIFAQIFVVITFGFLRLIFFWLPKIHARCTAVPCSLKEAEFLLIRDEHLTWAIRPIRTHQAIQTKRLLIPTAGAKMIETKCIRFFTFRKLKYLWNPFESRFAPIASLDNEVTLDRYHELAAHDEGLDEADVQLRQELYGQNVIDVQLKPILLLLFREFIGPFYIFQVYSVIVWATESYTVYAIVVVVMSLTSIALNTYQIRTQEKNLRDMVHSTSVVKVVRSGQSVLLGSEQLVPGDLVHITNDGGVMQCDAVLLNGTCIVNESMLTGESIPVTKVSLPMLRHINDTRAVYNSVEHAKHTLHCGTIVLQTRSADNSSVKALVIRTGFSTLKGQLVRSIMYPKPIDFRFTKDLFKFVAILAVIAAFGLAYSLWVMQRNGMNAMLLVTRSLDITTIVIFPALPAALTIGILTAQMRLKKRKIFCTSPSTINTCGGINVVCFDKTGTLTEDGLDFNCVRRVLSQDTGIASFDKEMRDLKNDEENADIVELMASCHSIARIDGELRGDPLELTLFNKTKWIFEDSRENECVIFRSADSRSNGELKIIQQFPFSSNLQRMSVIVAKGDGSRIIYCKGAPETIAALSRQNTIPPNFQEVVSLYAKRGHRLIALAKRNLNKSNCDRVQVERAQIESSLELLGLVVLENRLKSQSTFVINQLQKAKIRTIMVTGDNLLTAVSVASECNILTRHKRTFILDATIEDTPDEQLEIRLDQRECDMTDFLNVTDNGDFEATEGAAFAVLTQMSSSAVLDRVVSVCDVYARMSPEQKQTLVNRLQSIAYTVAMCGDGANDCGALKAAHAGISLTEAEASIASPFTSNTPDIRCVIDLIREGRAAIVTSFGIFKFMAGYSLTQFITVALLRYFAITVANNQYLYMDLLLATVFAAVFGYTEAAERLAPQSPPTRLLSFESLASLFGQLILSGIFQIVAAVYTLRQPWYNPYSAPKGDDVEKMRSMLGTSIFCFSLLQYIMLAVVWSKGAPYRKALTTNVLFCAALVIMGSVSATAILWHPQFIRAVLEYDIVPQEHRFFLILLALFACSISFLFEWWIIDFLISGVIAKYRQQRRDMLGSKNLKNFKNILASLNRLYPDLLSDDATDQKAYSDTTLSRHSSWTEHF